MNLSDIFPGPLQVERYMRISNEIEKGPEKALRVNYGIDLQKYSYLLDIRSIANMGLFASYFGIGFVGSFTRAPLQYYLIDTLDASSAQYAVYTVMHRLPWSIKFLFGLLSDTIPFLGYRRKPWLFFGWFGFTAFNLVLMYLQTPNIDETIYCTFAFTCCLAMADVCTDTLCVERANYESDENRGRLQSFGYIISSIGKVIGALAGTFLYNSESTNSLSIAQIFMINALAPVIGLSAVIWFLIEVSNAENVYHVSAQLQEAWKVLQLEAVWKPMIFLYVYSMLQVPNSAWYNFLVWGLGFSSTDLGYLTITSAVVGCMGYVIYDLFLFRSSWRNIFIGTSVVSFVVSMMQLSLMLGTSSQLGIPNIMMALGHDAVIALMEGLHAMPKFIMFIMLCPEGIEGTSFALLTTMTSMGTTVAYEIGSALTLVWDVSNETLAEGDFSGVIKLNILTSVLQLSPLLLIYLLPDNREEQQKAISLDRSSVFGGIGFILTLCISLALTVLSSIIM